MSEATEQHALFDFLARMEGRHPHFRYVFHPANEANGGGQTIKLVRGRKIREVPLEVLRGARMGVKPGVWDVWAPFRNRAEIFGYPAGLFCGLAIEMKSNSGDLSTEQKDWREFLRGEGWCCQVYKEWTLAARTLIQWVGGDPDLEVEGLLPACAAARGLL